MRPVVWSTVVAAGFLAWSGWAFAQHSHGGMRGGSMHGGGMRGGVSQGHGVRGHAPRVGPHTVSPGLRGRQGFRSSFRGSVTSPSFAGRLGRTVGRHPSSRVTTFPFPNINSPGGALGLSGHSHRGKVSRFPRRYRATTVLGPIFYTAPYYAYYSEYPYYVPATPVQPQLRPAPGATTVTLLAFKDSTVIAVTDYWLEGNWLVFETTSGMRTTVPLDRLDLALTQQLNFERKVPLILEARP